MLKVNLFFDESGKNGDSIKTMGSLMIPEKVYNCSEIINFNKRLQENEFKLHWTQYNGGRKESEIYKEIIDTFSKYLSLCEFNVIRYDYPPDINKNKLDRMIYSKIPERVMYGLLRYQGKGINIHADIYVEDATMYNTIKLHETICDDMNRQSLYRGTNFTIDNFKYKHKNEEIGVEFTDVILGIIRNIIDNNNASKRAINKNLLIVEFLKNKEFNKFLRNVKFFEWNYSNSLTKVDFSDYINIFLSGQEEWISYLTNKN
ncbi:DUF3800 domain-containing protein [Intestinibacter sp.]